MCQYSLSSFSHPCTASFEEFCKAYMHFVSMLVPEVRYIRFSTFFSVNLRSRATRASGKVCLLIGGLHGKKFKAEKDICEGNMIFSVRTGNSCCTNNASIMRTERTDIGKLDT